MKTKKELALEALIERKIRQKSNTIVDLKINKPSVGKKLEDSIFYRFFNVSRATGFILLIIIAIAIAESSSHEAVYYAYQTYPKYELNTMQFISKSFFYILIAIVFNTILFKTAFYIFFGNREEK